MNRAGRHGGRVGSASTFGRKMKSKLGTTLITALVLTVLGGVWFWWYQPVKKAGPHPQILEDMHFIKSAIENYSGELGVQPPGMSPQFFEVLAGKNERGIVFLGDDRLSSGIDPWGHHFQVFRSSTHWLIRSAGKNGVFDDLGLDGTDDILFTIPIIAEQDSDGDA